MRLCCGCDKNIQPIRSTNGTRDDKTKRPRVFETMQPKMEETRFFTLSRRTDCVGVVVFVV